MQCCGGAIRCQRQGVVSQPIALENEGIVTTPPPPPAPGWYPDPSGAAGQRYFDRVRWTDSRAPAHVPAPLAPKSAVAAGLLQLFLGWFGAGRWYIGTTNIAVLPTRSWLGRHLPDDVLLHRRANSRTAHRLDGGGGVHDVRGAQSLTLTARSFADLPRVPSKILRVGVASAGLNVRRIFYPGSKSFGLSNFLCAGS